MSRTTSIRLVAALVALTLMQVAFTIAATVKQCPICSGPNTPKAGRVVESCNDAAQTGLFDENNPPGSIYEPMGTGSNLVQCFRPPPGSQPCTDLRSGCCPSGDTGFFMCNIIVDLDCSYISQCASVCCPAGSQEVNEVVHPGCSLRSKFLVCNAASNNAP